LGKPIRPTAVDAVLAALSSDRELVGAQTIR
jgi:hypothetical protein